MITARKAVDQPPARGPPKTGRWPGRRRATLAGPHAGEGLGGLDQMVGSEPSSEFAALVADEHRRLLNLLGDDTLRRIAIWKMEGYTNEEIRVKLGCSLRTVANKLELIRRTWARRVGPHQIKP